MENIKKVLLNALKVFTLFLVICVFYYATNVLNLFSAFSFGFLTVGGIFILFFYMLYKKKLDKKEILIMILLLGICLRFTYGGYNNIFSRQHDVGKAMENGHYGYAVYIFRTLELPNFNDSQFYQPPLNAIIQALFMRFNSLIIPINEDIKEIYSMMFNEGRKFSYTNELISYIDTLYNTCRILSIFYSVITFLTIYQIINEFNLKDKPKYLILLIMATQPVLVMMSGTMNNDNLSFMFFFLALLYEIRWYKNQSYSNIILIALFIGLGMITKLSIGFIAFIIAPLFLIRFIEKIKEKKYFKLIPQFLVFAIIVFPLGLSYAIRNYILFDQSFTYILDFGRESWLHEVIKEKNIYERFFSLPVSQLFHKTQVIFHDYQEYNIWVDLIKTSIFEEFPYGHSPLACVFAGVMFLINLPYWLILIPSIVFIIYKLIKKNYEGDKFLVILAIGLIILALISYISLCIKMPYSCTSNFRYIAYISLGMIVLYSLVLENIKHKKLYDASYLILGIFSMASSLFILFI